MNTLTTGMQAKLSGRGERRWWTVRAADERYVILTMQAEFQPKGVLWYTIADFQEGRRGPCNLVGQGWDLTDDPNVGCAALLDALIAGEVQISHRNNRTLAVLATRTIVAIGGQTP